MTRVYNAVHPLARLAPRPKPSIPLRNLRFYSLHPTQAGTSSASSHQPDKSATLPGTAETGHLDRTQAAQPASTTTPPSQPQPAEPEAEPQRPNIYKVFGRPFAKVFLGAMLTYQVLYYAAERMRLNEVQEEKMAEVGRLEGEIEAYARRRKGEAI